MKVAVLCGGRSFERAVSLRSGERVVEALNELGHESELIDADAQTARRLVAGNFDRVFVALHGPGGEDGSVQELLEVLGIPYTGSRPAAARVAGDKALAKHAFQAAPVPTPAFFSLDTTALQDFGAAHVLGRAGDQLGYPLVVKPTAGGSALGIRFAGSSEDLPKALVSALSYGNQVVLEHYVEGRELAVGLTGHGTPQPLPVVQIRPRHSDYYDFESRYTHGETEFTCPPTDLDPAQEQRVRDVSVEAYRALGIRGFGRVDLILDGSGEPQVLEVNSVPGLTETSLVPLACSVAGLPFPELVQQLLDDAAR